MNRSVEHEKLKNEIMLYLSSRGFLVMATNVGLFRSYHNPNVVLKIGFEGLTDLMGSCPDGMSLYIEVKTGKGVRTKKQIAFAYAVIKRRCHYIEARSIADIERFLVTNYPQNV